MLSVKDLTAGYGRGMAFICTDKILKYNVVECVIPVLLSSPEGKICEHVVTGILVRFRFHSDSPFSDEADLVLFTGALECPHTQSELDPRPHERPYIAIVMDLGVKADPDKLPSTTPPTSGVTYVNNTEQTRRPTYPRYQILSFGHSPSTYRLISDTPTHKALLELLLQQKSDLDAPNFTDLFRPGGWCDAFLEKPVDESGIDVRPGVQISRYSAGAASPGGHNILSQ